MDWLMWLIMAWAVFAGGAITGSRCREFGLVERERRIAKQRAELHAQRQERPPLLAADRCVTGQNPALPGGDRRPGPLIVHF